MNFRITISSIVISAAFAAILWLATRVKKDPYDVPINLALVILGGSVGWVIGIFLTPYDGNQLITFGKYASFVSLFVSGYLVGKIDNTIAYLLKPENLFTPIIGFRTTATLASVLLGLLITVVIRFHAAPVKAIAAAAAT